MEKDAQKCEPTTYTTVTFFSFYAILSFWNDNIEMCLKYMFFTFMINKLNQNSSTNTDFDVPKLVFKKHMTLIDRTSELITNYLSVTNIKDA